MILQWIEGVTMLSKKIGLALFVVGVFCLFVHTTLPFIWALFGIPATYPLTSSRGIWAFLPGFTPAIGALILVLGGILYGKEVRR
jgi:hypothetical protein